MSRLEGSGWDVWIWDLEGISPTKLTDRGINLGAIWTPDGTSVTVESNQREAPGIYMKPVDGSDEGKLLVTASQLLATLPGSWTPDGRALVYHERAGDTGFDLWTVSVGTDPTPWLVTDFNEPSPRLSPDGR